MMDNATNNDTAIRILAQSLGIVDPEHRRLRCLGHIINLAAKALVENLASTEDDDDNHDDDDDNDDDDEINSPRRTRGPVDKLAFSVQYIRRSPLRRAEYRAVAEELNLPIRMVVSDNKTRFNSVCNMLRAALPARAAIDQFLWEEQHEHSANSSTRRTLRRNQLTPADWRDLETLHRLLRPFEMSTLAAEGISLTLSS
jgi:hypothetical protein